jgi:DNA-binding XRE family transcriptional regulator
MDRDWARLGAALKADRERQGHTQKTAARALSAALTSIQEIERGHEYTKPTRTIRAYAQMLGWTEGSVEQVLAGGAPDYLRTDTPPTDAAVHEAPADTDFDDKRLPLRIVHELSDEGELLDTAVIKIGEKGRAVIVVKGEPGVSADELLDELRAWNRKRASLEGEDGPDSSAAAEGS